MLDVVTEPARLAGVIVYRLAFISPTSPSSIFGAVADSVYSYAGDELVGIARLGIGAG